MYHEIAQGGKAVAVAVGSIAVTRRNDADVPGEDIEVGRRSDMLCATCRAESAMFLGPRFGGDERRNST